MNMKRTTIIVLLLLIFGVIAITLFISKRQYPQTVEEEEEEIQDPSYVGEPENEEKEILIENTDAYEINVELPASRSIGTERVSAFIENEVETFKTLAEEEAGSGLSARGDQSFTYNLDVAVETHESSEYFSYVVLIGEYTGGANANQRVETFVFEKNTGEQASLSDIVLEAEREEVLRELKSSLLELEGIFKESVEELTFSTLNTFYVERSGNLTFLFSKYEVAAGSAGIIEVTIER
jgi:hypothetical protein